MREKDFRHELMLLLSIANGLLIESDYSPMLIAEKLQNDLNNLLDKAKQELLYKRLNWRRVGESNPIP